MLARSTQTLGRRAFSTTRVMRSGHYPEGPGTNIPFNPKTRFFWARYWGFMGMAAAFVWPIDGCIG
jgi:cytochrome c oxidase subunit 7c